ncbi:MAG: transposase [Candidatus Didemnitutus sp.]|nr:transposase [Candidatus Didemnitutus sp.]
MNRPDRNHLRRLAHVWIENPIYFVTVCVTHRRPLLARTAVAEELRRAWEKSPSLHRWAIGRYVVMPDHVHFFARACPDAKSLADFMRDWKKWTSRRIASVALEHAPIWQPEYFDHVLRSAASYAEKWNYVSANPVRAGLATRAEDWPYTGECVVLTF